MVQLYWNICFSWNDNLSWNLTNERELAWNWALGSPSWTSINSGAHWKSSIKILVKWKKSRDLLLFKKKKWFQGTPSATAFVSLGTSNSKVKGLCPWILEQSEYQIEKQECLQRQRYMMKYFHLDFFKRVCLSHRKSDLWAVKYTFSLSPLGRHTYM